MFPVVPDTKVTGEQLETGDELDPWVRFSRPVELLG